jgi:predicted nucleic acid-binding protein
VILVDTSVWIDHLRVGNPDLVLALEEGAVSCHPFVIGEIACGTLANRAEVIIRLQQLRSALVATNSEVLSFIESRSLMGRGLGYVDVHLLASAAITPNTELWTNDRRLAASAESLSLNFTRPS